MDKLFTISDSPFVGPTPFEESDRDRFYGRQREIEELLSLIIAHRCVLVYAQSGTGKTSIVNAGVIPLLKRRSFNVLPPARVEGLIPTQIEAAEIQNIFAYHVLRSWTESCETLVASDLVAFLKAAVPGVAADDEAPPTTVLVLDQFEEFFTCNAQRWIERVPFFRQLGEALKDIRSLKIVFVMREEFLAQIEPFAELLPQKLRNRMHLERLRERPALAAIAHPLRMRNLEFEPGAAEELVSDLCKIRVVDADKVCEVPGEFVEPVHLQVVCQSIWRNLPEDWKNPFVSGAEKSPQITRAQVETFGDVNDALASYYERAVQSASNNAGIHEGSLRRWIAESLITPAGTRGMVLSSSADLSGIAKEALRVLDEAHVIHTADRAGTAWYELTHDRFIEAIQKSNRQWSKSFGRAEEIRKWVEDRATAYLKTGEVLDEGDLRTAEKFVVTPEATALGLTARVNQLVERSRQVLAEKEQQRLLEIERANNQTELERQLRRRDRRTARLILLAVTCIAFAVAFYLYQVNARLREQHELGRLRFERAQRDLRSPAPAHDAVALHDFAIALRYDRGNEDAAKKVCELLTQNAWCPPLTAPLHYPGAAILSATFSPDGKVFAVTGDGKLLSCDQDSSKGFKVVDTLFQAAQSDDQRAIIPATAVFSDNGSSLVFISPRSLALTQASGALPGQGMPTAPIGSPQESRHLSANAIICKWNSEKHTYVPTQRDIELAGSGSLYSVSWSGDEHFLVIVNIQGNRTTCQVFQLDLEGTIYTLNEPASKNLTDANVAAVAFSSNIPTQVATISAANDLHLHDAGFKPIPVAGRLDGLKSIPPAGQLAFGPKEDEFTVTTWGGGIWRLDIHTGNLVPMHPKFFYDFHDRLARIATLRRDEAQTLVACCLYSRITIADKDMNELAEPIAISEPLVALARVKDDGEELLTLSGSIWNAYDTVRVSSLSMLNHAMPTNIQFDGKFAPDWLAELADAVSGQQPDDEKSFWTVRKLYAEYSKEQRSGEYDVVWRRFFAN
jgi:hypothetical protein